MIPTPEAAERIDDYELLYPSIFKSKKGYVRHTGTLEDLSFSRSKYTADELDMKFLNVNNNKLNDESDRIKLFEHVIECFDEAANRFSEEIVNTKESLERIQTDKKLSVLLEKCDDLTQWLTYWREKRKDRGGVPLILSLKFEDVGKVGSDPYVCFRRRELKQPRKTRRSDAQVMEKVKKIRYDLVSVKMMLSAGIKRDKLKKESLLIESAAFEKYWTLRMWQQEFGIERPPTLPSFKSFHQQTPQLVKENNSSQTKTVATSSTKTTSSNPSKLKKIDTAATSEDDLSENENGGISADLIRISIPPAAIKNVRFSRPYYPFEVVKQIQKEVEGLMINEDPLMIDYTADLGSISVGSRCKHEKFINFRNNIQERNQMYRDRHEGDSNFVVMRRSRTGRLVEANSRQSTNLHFSAATSEYSQYFDPNPVLNDSILMRDRMFYPNYMNKLRSIQARDCAHLNNAFVGNYNQHYIQCTSNLSTPTSLPAWIAATSSILQAGKGTKNTSSSSGAGNNNNSNTSNNNNNNNTGSTTGGSSSPLNSPNKKKRPLEDEEEDDLGDKEKEDPVEGEAGAGTGEESASKKLKSLPSAISTEAAISSLTSSPQFTVKVKSRMNTGTGTGTPLSIGSGGGVTTTAAASTAGNNSNTVSGISSSSEDVSDMDEVSIPTRPSSTVHPKRANSARFTPTGLQKEK